MDAILELGGMLRWRAPGGARRERNGVVGFAFARHMPVLAAVDLGGVSVLDVDGGATLARRRTLCAARGLVRFAMEDSVVVFVAHDHAVQAWDWVADVHLASLCLPASPSALAVCDAPVIAALFDDQVRVFDLARGQTRDVDVDPRATSLRLSPTGDVVEAVW